MSDVRNGGEPKLNAEVPFDGRDFIGAIGVGLIGYGAWLIYPPAGFIAPGLLLTYVAIFGVRH